MHVGNVHVAQSMYILSPRQHLVNLVMTCTFQSRHAQIEVMSHMHIRNVHVAHNLYQLPVYFLSVAVLRYKNICFSYVGISM